MAKKKFKTLKDPQARKRLAKIRYVVVDVDGVLTDARIFWQDGWGWSRLYNVRDGFGLSCMLRMGLGVGIISAGNSKDIERRAEHLGIKDVYMGKEDKLGAFLEILSKYKLKPEETIYIADELFDIPVLEKAGFAVTVPEAPEEVVRVCDYVTKKAGGFGAVREVCDAIRAAQPEKSIAGGFKQ